MAGKIIISILLSIACLSGNRCISQRLNQQIKPDQYRAIHWTTEDGLPVGDANVMFKDANGFLWIGSRIGELCRFDGTVFKKYLPDQQKRGVINSDAIFSFKEDSLDNIWIGTGKGLSGYDSKADAFTNFSPFMDSAPQLTIAPFWAIQDEVLCMELGSLITAINIHTLKRERLKIVKEIELEIHWNTNKSFFDAGSNSIWKLQDNGRLEQIFLDRRETTHYSWPCYRNHVHHPRHNDRIAMMQSSNGNESPVEINELVNGDGSAAGTEITIKMPVISSHFQFKK